MSRTMKQYKINIIMPKSQKELKFLRKKAIKAYDKLLNEHIRWLPISEKEKKDYYDNIMKNILGNKENGVK